MRELMNFLRAKKSDWVHLSYRDNMRYSMGLGYMGHEFSMDFLSRAFLEDNLDSTLSFSIFLRIFLTKNYEEGGGADLDGNQGKLI